MEKCVCIPSNSYYALEKQYGLKDANLYNYFNQIKQSDPISFVITSFTGCNQFSDTTYI